MDYPDDGGNKSFEILLSIYYSTVTGQGPVCGSRTV